MFSLVLKVSFNLLNTEHKLNVHETLKTRVIYVQFTSHVQGCHLYLEYDLFLTDFLVYWLWGICKLFRMRYGLMLHEPIIRKVLYA